MASLDKQTFTQQYRDEVERLLEGVSFQNPGSECNYQVEKDTIQYFQSSGFSVDFLHQAYPALKASCIIATTTYPFVPSKVQEVIAVYTTFAILIDDTNNVAIGDLQEFLRRLCRGLPQPNQLLRAMLQFIGSVIPECYGSFASDMIMKAIIEFISSNVVENKYKDKISLPSTAPDFPYYFRHKTGMADAYAFLAFPEALFPEERWLSLYLPVIPDIVLYFNLVNDFLSFYKESVVENERLNYIYNYAHTHQITPLESLHHCSSMVIEGVDHIRASLMSYPRLKDALEQVFAGYITYHCSSSRYRLSELDIPDIQAAKVSTEGRFDAIGYIGGNSSTSG